jgi:FlaA1/EpsC-like NDP-sugar epimerase
MLFYTPGDVDVVIHAVALTQVPACEYNPFEAIQTNVLGAKNVLEAAIDRKVKRVVVVSTDKAVNPTNLYGATKAFHSRQLLFRVGDDPVLLRSLKQRRR